MILIERKKIIHGDVGAGMAFQMKSNVLYIFLFTYLFICIYILFCSWFAKSKRPTMLVADKMVHVSRLNWNSSV